MNFLKTKIIFLILSIVSVGQVIWWIHLLNNPTALTVDSQVHFQRMVLSEGGFFIFVLLFGIALAYRSILQESKLRNIQLDFLSAISHELKAPISNVRLCLDTLERSNLSEEKRITFLKRAQRATNKLLNEIEMILAFAHSKVLHSSKQLVDLLALVQNCIQEQIDNHDLKAPIQFNYEPSLTALTSFESSKLIINSLSLIHI